MFLIVFRHGFFVHFFQRDALMFVVEFKEVHCSTAFRAAEGIIAKRRKDKFPPLIEGAQDGMLFFRYGSVELLVILPVSGIESVVTDHFEVLFKDMMDEAVDEFHGRNGFCDKFIIFMSVVMECDLFAVVSVNAGSGNDRSSEIASDIFVRLTLVRFCIEAIFMIFVNGSFDFFEVWSEMVLEFIEECSSKGVTQKPVVKV